MHYWWVFFIRSSLAAQMFLKALVFSLILWGAYSHVYPCDKLKYMVSIFQGFVDYLMPKFPHVQNAVHKLDAVCGSSISLRGCTGKRTTLLLKRWNEMKQLIKVHQLEHSKKDSRNRWKYHFQVSHNDATHFIIEIFSFNTIATRSDYCIAREGPSWRVEADSSSEIDCTQPFTMVLASDEITVDRAPFYVSLSGKKIRKNCQQYFSIYFISKLP